VVIAGLAWVLTIGQAREMGVEPGTMGLALPLFRHMEHGGPQALGTAFGVPGLAVERAAAQLHA
jgi:hypothetical protein